MTARLVILAVLVASPVLAASTARCVKWERVNVVEYGLLPNGKLHITSNRWVRRNTYIVDGEQVDIVAADSDDDERKQLKALTGKTVTLDKSKVKP
jgi:hypothetical protein